MTVNLKKKAKTMNKEDIKRFLASIINRANNAMHRLDLDEVEPQDDKRLESMVKIADKAVNDVACHLEENYPIM